MQPTSFGQHRGQDWLSRVAFAPHAQQPAFERFVLRLHDPRHARALWICVSLERAAGAQAVAVARSQAVYFSKEAPAPGQGPILQADELWPVERAAIDPERGGLGVGECWVAPSHSQGLVRGQGMALAWDLTLAAGEQDANAGMLLPRAWLYRHRRLSHKAAAPVLAGRVAAGRLELWHGLGRHAPCTRLDVAGWSASLSHTWGHAPWQDFAQVHAHALVGQPDSFLQATAFSARALGALALAPRLGLVQLNGRRTPFTGWQALGWRADEGAGRRAAAAADATAWPLRLGAGDAQLTGEVCAAPQHLAVVAGPFGRPLAVCGLAELTATLLLPGAPARPLQGEQICLEQLLPAAPATAAAGRAA